ncbi:MAG: S9 family peptidase [Deltaproteobacteria bacterium]|nr:S9 family peptidase [Deltaproteobacteria bacterium]
MKKIFFIIILFGFSSCNCPENKVQKNKSNSGKKLKHPKSRLATIEKEINSTAIKTAHFRGPVLKPDVKIENKKFPPGKVFASQETEATRAKKKPFTIGALYKIKNISSPDFCSDETKVVAQVTEYDIGKGKSSSNLFLFDLKDNREIQLTKNSKSNYSPVFSKNCESVYFLSTRNDSPQVFKISLKGGEPEKLTSVPDGVSEFTVSDDEKYLVYSTSCYPDSCLNFEKHKTLDAEKTANPLKAYISDELLYRHWTSWRGEKRNHIISHNLENGKLIDLTPGKFDSPAFSLGEHGFVISPDSKEIAYTAFGGKPETSSWSTNKDIFIVSMSGGTAINISKKNSGYDGTPTYSPDGKYLAYRTQKTDGYESDKFNLIVMERTTGKSWNLTDKFENWIYEYQWENGHSIVFQSPVKGRYPLYRVDTGTFKIQNIPGVISSREFSVSGKGSIAISYSKVEKPVELYTISSAGEGKQISSFNKKVESDYDIRPAEEMWIPGANGIKVHTFIVKPHGFKPGRKYPVIINVHGGPQMQWSDSFRGDWQVYPGSGYVVAFPNPHGSTGYGQKYTAGISGDWNGKVFKDVMAVTKALSELPYVDNQKMGAMGWSYGGYMMNYLLGNTDKFKAIASMMGVYDLNSFYSGTEELWFPEWDLNGPPWKNTESYKKQSPSSYAANFKTPTLVITGEKDYRVPYTQSLQLFTALRRQNIPARLIVFPNDGHWPSYAKSLPLYYLAHLEWFSKYLGGDKPPVTSEKAVLSGYKMLLE